MQTPDRSVKALHDSDKDEIKILAILFGNGLEFREQAGRLIIEEDYE